MVIPLCTKCRKAIHGEDVNVTKDVAFCRSCNLAHKLSELVQAVSLEANLDVTRPPSGAWYQSSALGAVIGATHRSLGRRKTEIVLETQQGRCVRFGSMLREDRMKFIAGALRQVLPQN